MSSATRRRRAGTVGLGQLDHHVLRIVLDFLNAEDLFRCRLVSRGMNTVATDPSMWLARCAKRAGVAARVQVAPLAGDLHPMLLWQHVPRRVPRAFSCKYFAAIQVASLEDEDGPAGPAAHRLDQGQPGALRFPASGTTMRVQSASATENERAVVADSPFPRVMRGSGLLPRHASRTIPFLIPLAGPDPSAPLDLTPLVVSYFEVDLEPAHPEWPPGRAPCVAVGVCNRRFPLSGRLPGWDAHSYGWHSDDGMVFWADSHGRPFGAPFGAGDTIGCGIDLVACLPTDDRGFDPAAARLFFTRNGVMQGYAFSGVDSSAPWYPAVGIDGPTPVHFRSGREPGRPFRFPLARFAQGQWQAYAKTHPVVPGIARGRIPAGLPP